MMSNNTENPYASPQADIERANSLPSFIDPLLKGNLAVKAFYAVLVLQLAYIVTQFWRASTFTEYLETQSNLSVIVKGDKIELMIILGLFLANVTAIILFLRWFHQCYKNLSALGADKLEYSPGWAVGWFFIPFANVVKPYSVASEMWRASAVSYPNDKSPSSWVVGPTGWLVPFWWLTFLVYSIFQRFVSGKINEAKSLEDLLNVIPLDVISSVLNIVGVFTVVLLIKKLSKRQYMRFEAIQGKA